MRCKMYLHSSKDDNQSQGREIDLSAKQLWKFVGALYEVEFLVDIKQDGTIKILRVKCDNQILEPVE